MRRIRVSLLALLLCVTLACVSVRIWKEQLRTAFDDLLHQAKAEGLRLTLDKLSAEVESVGGHLHTAFGDNHPPSARAIVFGESCIVVDLSSAFVDRTRIETIAHLMELAGEAISSSTRKVLIVRQDSISPAMRESVVKESPDCKLFVLRPDDVIAWPVGSSCCGVGVLPRSQLMPASAKFNPSEVRNGGLNN